MYLIPLTPQRLSAAYGIVHSVMLTKYRDVYSVHEMIRVDYFLSNEILQLVHLKKCEDSDVTEDCESERIHLLVKLDNI